jgi:hypothetical protein
MTMGCPFLDARSPEEARKVLREGMTDWHSGESSWAEFIDKVLGSVGGPLPDVAGNTFGITERERRIDPNPDHWSDDADKGPRVDEEPRRD